MHPQALAQPEGHDSALTKLASHALLCAAGFVLIALCMRQRVRGAMLVGILWVRTAHSLSHCGTCTFHNQTPLHATAKIICCAATASSLALCEMSTLGLCCLLAPGPSAMNAAGDLHLLDPGPRCIVPGS